MSKREVSKVSKEEIIFTRIFDNSQQLIDNYNSKIKTNFDDAIKIFTEKNSDTGKFFADPFNCSEHSSWSGLVRKYSYDIVTKLRKQSGTKQKKQKTSSTFDFASQEVSVLNDSSKSGVYDNSSNMDYNVDYEPDEFSQDDDDDNMEVSDDEINSYFVTRERIPLFYLDEDGNPVYYLDDENNQVTQCLKKAVEFRLLLKSLKPENPIVNRLISAYTADQDWDDVVNEFDMRDIGNTTVIYGFVKEMMQFLVTGKIYEASILFQTYKDLIESILDDDDDSQSAKTAKIDDLTKKIENLLRRVGLMTEVLWNVLNMWPFRVPSDGPSIKLYVGIGIDNTDPNYYNFVGNLFNSQQVDNDVNNFIHRNQSVASPRPDILITSSHFVSSSYSFDAAARFCKNRHQGVNRIDINTTIRCMLEIIVPPGFALPLIANSSNEAEVLLKPGNVYRFVNRYPKIYDRKYIYIYQFVLINDTNPYIPITPDMATAIIANAAPVAPVAPRRKLKSTKSGGKSKTNKSRKTKTKRNKKKQEKIKKRKTKKQEKIKRRKTKKRKE